MARCSYTACWRSVLRGQLCCRLTALALDSNSRRLMTASNAGELKMWNFNNGSQLKEFTHHEPHMEFSTLAFIHDSHKQSNQVGNPVSFSFLF